MGRHKLQGSVSTWMAAYDAEMDKVKSTRLRELHGAEREKVLKEEKVIRLRMKPEPKKNGPGKMRLLVMGHTEPGEWNDGKCLDSPTVMASSVKMMIAIDDGTYYGRGIEVDSDYDGDDGSVDGACDNHMQSCGHGVTEISVGDISSAFLTSPGYLASGGKRYVAYIEYKGGRLHVYQLLGSLYGLRDAPYRFYTSLAEFLQSIGFKKCRNDVCMYVHKERKILMGTHVDDVIVRADKHQSEWFRGQMEAKYRLKSWGFVEVDSPKTYCAMQVSLRVVDGQRWYDLDQNADVSVFIRDNMNLGLRPVKAPGPNKHALEKDVSAAPLHEQKWFRSCLMSASWFAVSTRLDISHAISRLAQKMAAPTVSAVSELKRLIAYLMYRPEFTLTVCRAGRTENEYGFYVDSDHAGEQPYTSRSHTGIMLEVNGMPCVWKSNKQPITVMNSAAAEIYAFSEAVKEVNLLLWRAEEVGVKVQWPVKIYEDNKATISFQQSTTPRSKLKGVYNLRWNWVQQLKDKKRYEATKVGTDANKADLETKCYTPSELTRMLKLYKGVLTNL